MYQRSNATTILNLKAGYHMQRSTTTFERSACAHPNMDGRRRRVPSQPPGDSAVVVVLSVFSSTCARMPYSCSYI